MTLGPKSRRLFKTEYSFDWFLDPGGIDVVARHDGRVRSIVIIHTEIDLVFRIVVPYAVGRFLARYCMYRRTRLWTLRYNMQSSE